MNKQADMRNEVRPTVPHSALEAEVLALHAAYEKRTGFAITLTLDRQRMWREWISFREPAFTADDLLHVIAYLRSEINFQKRNEGSLKFLNLIGKVDQFEEDLALALRWKRPQAARSPAAAPVHAAGDAPAGTPEERARSFREAVSTTPPLHNSKS